MATAKRRTEKKPARPVTTALRLQPPSEALAALMRERSRLLKAIAKKQLELEQARERERVVAETLFERMQPLVSEHAALQQEIRTLFDALLAEGRLSRTARKKVAEVFHILNESGELDPFTSSADDEASDAPDFDFDPFDDFAPGSSPPPSHNVSSAKHTGGQPGHESLRGLFRRLAVALHPDLVQDEHEHARRTEVMKDVTRAYEEGNLARLIEIEQLFLGGQDTRGNASADASKCTELERAVAALRSQQKSIAAEIKTLRSSSPLAAVFGRRRVKPEEQAEQLDAIVASASEELEPLRQTRDFVRAFSERKITLTEFLRGPTSLRADEFDLAEAMLEFVFRDLGVDIASAQPSAGRKKARNAKRSRVNFDDLPF
jgi:hypothetical protein